jgi:hypothetical protein
MKAVNMKNWCTVFSSLAFTNLASMFLRSGPRHQHKIAAVCTQKNSSFATTFFNIISFGVKYLACDIVGNPVCSLSDPGVVDPTVMYNKYSRAATSNNNVLIFKIDISQFEERTSCIFRLTSEARMDRTW